MGLSGGAAIVLLIVLYFVIKWAVRGAIDDSKREIAKAVQNGIRQYEQEKRDEALPPLPDEEDSETE